MVAGYQLKFYKNHGITQDEMDRAIDRALWGIRYYLKKNGKPTLSLMGCSIFDWKTSGIPSNIEIWGYSTPEYEVLEMYTFT